MMALGVRLESPRICRHGVGVRLQEVEGMPAGLSPECLPVRRVPLTPPNRLSFGPRSPAAETAFLCSVCVARGQVLVSGKTLGSSCGGCGWNCLEVGAPSHGWAVRGYRYLITLEVDL